MPLITALRSRPRRALLLLALVAAISAFVAVQSRAAIPIPVPNPVVMVHTKSGNVERTTPVPIGGAPVAIDVDDGGVAGLLKPDITASVALTTLDQLPGKPVAPVITFRRSALAVTTKRPAPPVEITATVQILDAAKGLAPLATVDYGYTTPAGGRMPPLVQAQLLGPLQSGFIDPLDVEIRTPGYGGALDFHTHVKADGFDGNFDIGYDPLPERIRFVMDQRADGFDAHYEHDSQVDDVHLAASATLSGGAGTAKQRIGAEVERLPKGIDMHYTAATGKTTIEYQAQSAVGKPDVRASFSDTAATGAVTTDARIAAAGVPAHLRAIIDAAGGELTAADVTAFGDQIDALDFVAGNGPGAPAIELGPRPFIGFAQRVVGGDPVYRASGHLEQIRAAHVQRDGAALDLNTDIGSGQRPLRLRLDSDQRASGDGAIDVDAMLRPLPAQAHVVLQPSDGKNGVPTQIRYDTSAALDADVKLKLADGAASGCGEAEVTCVDAAVDHIPAKLAIDLPAGSGTDYRLSHTGAAQLPDVRATIEQASAYVELGLDDVPAEVRGRLAFDGSLLHAAEFHPCAWDFAAEQCPGGAQPSSLGAVRFDVRDKRLRPTELPPRRDLADTFVSVIARGSHFEASGRMTDFREAAFRQRSADGPLGARVAMGDKQPFDMVLDTADTDASLKLGVHIDELPPEMSACVRPPATDKPPSPVGGDQLLGPCERTDVLGRSGDQLDTTPLSAEYRASAKMKVTAELESRAKQPDDDHRFAVTSFKTTIDKVPARVRADVIAPAKATDDKPAQKLEVGYDADDDDDATDDTIPVVDVDFAQRREGSACADPRANQRAICAHTRLTDVPRSMSLTYDSAADGGFQLKSANNGMSVRDLDLSLVGQGDEGGFLRLTGDIEDLPHRMDGRIKRVVNDAGKEELGAIDFQACEGCAIGNVDFTATNARGEAGLPATPGGVDADQELSYVQRGERFRVHGDIAKLRRASMSTLDPAGKPTKAMQIDAAFGDPGSKLRARVDTDDGTSAKVIDAVITHSPDNVSLCFRPAVAQLQTDASNWCAQQDKDHIALMAVLAPDADVRPDIELRELLISDANGASVTSGSATLQRLGKRLEVLIGDRKGASEPDIRVTGRNADGSGVVDAAAHVDFDLRTFAGDLEDEQFPWVSLDGNGDGDDESLEPEQDTRNDGNYVKVISDRGATRIAGSVPHVREVGLAPGACAEELDETPGRWADPGIYADQQRPSVQCVRVNAASGSKLGILMRIRGEHGQALALEDGHVDHMPVGGLRATIASSPGSIGGAPVCPAPQPGVCRPPLLVVRSANEDGVRPTLEGKLMSGATGDLEDLTSDADPRDPVSWRLDYDQSPRTWAADRFGGRLKIGSDDFGTALRANLRLSLPKRVDLDPPTTFSEVTENMQRHSSDTVLKIVAEDELNSAGPDDTLGRFAVLVHDLANAKQVIVTGAPPAPVGEGKQGTPETGVPTGAHDLGFELPSHTDIRIHMRDFQSKVKDLGSRNFIQVDGRTNRELSMSMRLDESDLGETRDTHQIASNLSLALRRAPGRPHNGNYVDPNFRVRAEIRSGSHAPGGDDLNDGCGDKPGDPGPSGIGFSGRAGGFGVDTCLYLPVKAAVHWLDVGLDANPDGAGGKPPARTVDAVVKTGGGENDAEIKGYDGIETATSGRGDPTAVSATAALRLAPFDLGMKVGAGLGIAGGSLELYSRGDLIVNLHGDELDRLRLGQWYGSVRLANPAYGEATLSTDLKSKVTMVATAEALFGAIKVPTETTVGPFPQDINFNNCFTQEVFTDKVSVNANTGANFYAMSFGIPEGGPDTQFLASPFEILSNIVVPTWCLVGGAGGSASANPLGAPAPQYALVDHPIEATVATTLPPDAPLPLADVPPVDDLVVHAGPPLKLCDSVRYRNVTVETGGKIVVGKPGETVTYDVGVGPATRTVAVKCTGGLRINAQRVTVEQGGSIDAHALVSAAGEGTPAGAGAGAGGFGAGGDAGNGSAGGSHYGPTGSYKQLPGSPGAAGSGGAVAGAGGGVVSIDARDAIIVNGTIDVSGGAGAPAGAACTAVGAGGGSGGAIDLSSNRIFVPGGHVLANGGAGGNGGNAGGPGSGGRISLTSVRQPIGGQDVSALAGAHGTPGGGCADSGDAGNGSTGLGEQIDMIAAIARGGADADSEYAPNGFVALRADALNASPVDDTTSQVIVCPRRLAPGGDTDLVHDPRLDPQENASVQTLLLNGCRSFDPMSGSDPDAPPFPAGYQPFGDELVGSFLYELQQGDGYYGIFAFAAKPKPGMGTPNCASLVDSTACDYQSHLPERAAVRVIVDETDPVVTLVPKHAKPGCAGHDNIHCVTRGTEVIVTAEDAISGKIEKATCSIDQPAGSQPCNPGGSAGLKFEDFDGLARVTAKAKDGAGHTGHSDTVNFLVDGHAPTLAPVHLSWQDADTNGWHRKPPVISTDVTDPYGSNPAPPRASGFAADGIGIVVDGKYQACGGPSHDGADAVEVECLGNATVDTMVSDGAHAVWARATDRAGNTAETPAVVTRVDGTAPTAELAILPEQPDGQNQWYRTKPILAFEAYDDLGGSGIDPEQTGSGIFYRVDGEAQEHRYEDGISLGDGIHEVCWWAVDVAGNAGDEQCTGDIKVDTKAPTVVDGLTPAAPDGDAGSGYHRTAPVVKPLGNEPATMVGAKNQASGLATVRYRLDDGGWQPAPPATSFTVPDGHHVTAVRATDHAGNVSEYATRDLLVDTHAPAVEGATFPPAPNERGWFRAPVTLAVAGIEERGGSGDGSRSVRLDGGSSQPYTAPVELPEGDRSAAFRARDRAGSTGPESSTAAKIDSTAPTAAPAAGTPAALLLPGSTTTLGFTASDDRSATVRVRVEVLDELEVRRRTIVAAGQGGSPYRAAGAGSVTWDGRGNDGKGLLPGMYHYRVVAVDEAGNAVSSTESAPFLVLVPGL